MPRRHRALGPALAALLLALSGCEDQLCLLGASSPIRVYVLDANTEQSVAEGATLVLRDGDYVDSVTIALGDSAWYADRPISTNNSVERPGIYDVTVRRPGFADWHRANVRVSEGDCGLEAVTLTARLQPLD